MAEVSDTTLFVGGVIIGAVILFVILDKRDQTETAAVEQHAPPALEYNVERDEQGRLKRIERMQLPMDPPNVRTN